MTIDDTGRPNLTQDMNQTPFIVGLPLPQGVELSEEGFTGSYHYNQADLTWTTLSENTIGGFHILRSENINGPYLRISGLIEGIGNPFWVGSMPIQILPSKPVKLTTTNLRSLIVKI